MEDDMKNQITFSFSDKQDHVNKVLDDITKRWNTLKVEIGSVETMLQQMIDYWTRYTACVETFQIWLPEAEQAIKNLPEKTGVGNTTYLSYL